MGRYAQPTVNSIYSNLTLKYTELNQDIINIRTAVFIEEQGFKNEFDETDENCFHIVLYDKNKAVATARYFVENDIYHIGRVAIIKEYRGLHIGNKIMQILEDEIKKDGGKKIQLSAQVRVSNFYKKNGYSKIGEIYFDEYCEHITMEKTLN